MKTNTSKSINNNIWQKMNIISSFVIILLCAISPSFCGGFEFSYTLPVSFVLLLCTYVNLRANKDKTMSKVIYIGSFCILLAMVFLTVFSSNVYLSLGNIIMFGTAFLLVIASSNIFRDKKFILFFAIALVSVCGIICLIVFRNTAVMSGGGALFREKLINGTLDRIFGTFINPNFYAAYLCMVFPVSLGLIFVFKETKYSLICSILSIFILINLCMTGSKFGFIALFLGIISMLICLIITKSFNKQTLKTTLIISAICILFLCLFSGTLISRVESAGTTQVHSAEFRILTWKATVNMIKANPIIGVFPGRYSEAYPQYTIASLTKHAHSSYLQFASEYGLIIYFVCLCGIVLILCNIPKIKNKCECNFKLCNKNKITFIYSGFIGGLIACLVHNLVDSDLYICSILFIFALICGFLLSLNKEEQTPVFLNYKFANVALIYIIGCLWILISVVMFMRQDYSDSYKIFPNNYMALRELASTTSGDINSQYLKKAADKAPKDYISYQLLGDSYMQNSPNSDMCLLYYEKAINFHPHSTLNMIKICDWATLNGKTDIAEKYYKIILDQENSFYEKLKGIPELVNTDYCQAHIFFGDKYLSEGNKDNAIIHYKSALSRYEKWLSPENRNFHIVSIITGQKPKNYYDNNLNLYKNTIQKLENLEGVLYEEKVNNIDKEYKNILVECNNMNSN